MTRYIGSLIKLTFLLQLISFSEATLAETAVGGGVIVRIPDGLNSRCVNGATDQINLYLISMVSQKRDTIFAETDAVGLYIETVIEGATSTSDKKVIIPRSFMINIADYDSDLVRAPVEQKLLSRFKLRNGNNLYSNAIFRIKFVSSKTDGPARIALAALSDITKRFPIPSNPFIEGADYFVELANSFVSTMMDENNNPDQIKPEAQLAFEFSQDGQCTGQLETTGIKAVIKEFSGTYSTNSQYINLAKIEDYCFRYSNETYKRIEFAKKPETGCTQAQAFKPVLNPHYVFALNATTVPTQTSTLRKTSYEIPGTTVWDMSGNGKTTDATLSSQEISDGWQAWASNNLQAGYKNHEVLSAMKNYSNLFEAGGGFENILAGKGATLSNFGNSKVYEPNSEIAKSFAQQLGIPGASENLTDVRVIDWNLSGIDAVGQDVYESTQRCKILGISPDSCF